jgi:hypothetical protein
MELWKPGWKGGDLHLDEAYKAALPEFHERKNALGAADIPDAFRLLWEGR